MISINENKIPFFSVIITAFNRLEMLKRAVNSLRKQTEKDWEAIIVDDGGIDETYRYAIALSKKDRRFRYMYHANRGIAMSKNAGVLAASGVYITFLDSDDEYLPKHLELRKKIFLDHPHIEFLHGGAVPVGDRKIPDLENPGKMIDIDDRPIGGTFFIRKERFIELRGFPNVKYGDDLNLYKLAKAEQVIIAKTNEKTYIYHRDSKDSALNSIKTGKGKNA